MTIKLGYLVPEFPRQTHIFFWRECEELRKLDIEPVFLSTRRPPSEACPHEFRDRAAASTHYIYPPKLSSCFTFLRHPIRSLRVLTRWLRLRLPLKTRLKYLGFILCAADMVQHCQRMGVKHIHVHSCADAAMLALFAHELGGLTYSLTLHNPLAGHGAFQREKWENAAFGIVVANVFLEEIKRELAGYLPPHLYVAPMGTDLQKFVRAEPYSAWQKSGPLRLFACGRLNPCKGHDLLIAAVKSLVDAGIDAQLEIAGEDQDSGTGQFRRELEEAITRHGLQDRVQLLGALTEVAVRERLTQAHLFILASRTGEAMPVVLIEAMAMCVPVIATDVGGTKELVRDGETGFVVAPGDIEALAKGIRRLADDAELALRFSKAGRQMVETGFGSERSAKTIAEAIEKKD